MTIDDEAMRRLDALDGQPTVSRVVLQQTALPRHCRCLREARAVQILS